MNFEFFEHTFDSLKAFPEMFHDVTNNNYSITAIHKVILIFAKIFAESLGVPQFLVLMFVTVWNQDGLKKIKWFINMWCIRHVGIYNYKSLQNKYMYNLQYSQDTQT